jgi:L-ascorbate metabolism protein UlaG (beta-lactamase superfamily)
LDITWLGHSCFRIKGKDAVVLTDPFEPSLGFSLAKQKADIVTVSHFHPGHSFLKAVENYSKAIKGPGEYELKGVFITGIPTFHDASNGDEKGKNTVYILEIDGITLCHLGDIGHKPSLEIEEELGEISVLFIPVGGVSTIDGSVAADIVKELSPKIVIPMHYKIPALKKELDPVDVFLKKLGSKEVISQPRLSVTRASLPAATQVIVLTPPNR